MSSTMPTNTSQLTGTYRVDPAHTRVGFTARHAMVTKVNGSFERFRGEGYFDVHDPSQSRLQLIIEADSIDTQAPRSHHLTLGIDRPSRARRRRFPDRPLLTTGV